MLSGVNYASAAGGILGETGQHLGGRFSLSQQVMNFESNVNDLRNEMGPNNFTQYLAKSIALMVMGSNDYLMNYLLPYLYNSSHNYTPQGYADHLLNHYTRQILALHSVGLRKFFLAGLGPLGCIPYQLALNQTPPGQCVSGVNEIVGLFNVGLKSLVDQLNGNHTGAIFLYGNAYGAVGDMLNNPSVYGFQVTNEGCCGLGRNKGQVTCLPLSIPCANRDQYIFWDAFHPTQAVNAIFAQRTFSGPTSYCYPINIRQMALK
ncbi:GDSL esterase/lipase [Cinnamomum micranthum f. kanehirae]|uniref:GDSL esterase/lipase n=1 Tax=Cinnamomum micranthum f. kanehirae TaxID=337451 RepID=A0A3S4PJ83_9MAGN|nr:GDSL esterase/lipase [Cinnamomum micranthum f. kanehirae]